MQVSILDTVDKLRTFFETPHPEEYLVIDTETDGVQEKTAKLYGIGLCFNGDEAVYIPVRKLDGELWWKEKTEKKLKEELTRLIQSKKVIGHNIIYDVLILKNNWQIDLIPSLYSDTILLKHMIDEERPFGLKEVAVKYLGEWADKAQKYLYDNIKKNGGKTTKENLEMYKANTEVLGEYCGWDVLLTYKLFELFSKKLTEQGSDKLFYEEEVMPLYRECVIPMKDKGFYIDVSHFERLKYQILKDMEALEDKIQAAIKEDVREFEEILLNKECPVNRTGYFPKFLAEECGLSLPVTNNRVKLTKKDVELAQLGTEPVTWTDFILWNKAQAELSPSLLSYVPGAQRKLYFQKHPAERYIFNLNSNKHLAWLLFEKYGEEPEGRTETGAPQLNVEALDKLEDKYPFIKDFIDYKKLQKLSSTYIEGVLDREVNGVIHASFLMFGTTSGRFSSVGPNLQNIPRVKDDESPLSPLVLKYTNEIKQGFIAPDGYKIVNADYSALEPRAFASASGDKKLQHVFVVDHDLYSSIAIESLGLNEYSADPKSPKYLKKHRPEARQRSKVICLAIVYGAEAGRISQILKCDYTEAQQIIDDYLDAYPELKSYMKNCDTKAVVHGYVKSPFGRVRHLPEAKAIYSRYGWKLLDRKWVKQNALGDLRYRFKSLLNNAKNFPIQSTAAHVVNRAMIRLARLFKEHEIDGWIAAQVHDEITCIVREDQTQKATELLKDAMENTTKISVPLIAEPIVGRTWAESK